MEEQIKPIYEALIGCFSSCQTPKEQPSIYDESIWDQYNSFLSLLKDLCHEEFAPFEITVNNSRDWGRYVSCQEYRTKLNSLIMYIHGKYFSKEIAPFGNTSGTIINQNQSQNQNIQISIIIEMQDLIDKKLYGEKLEENEKTFLQKIKSILPNIKTATELVQQILVTATSLGIDINILSKLFLK